MGFWLLVFIVSLPFLLLLFRERKGPVQFSLRTLLVVVTIVALVLGGIGWWRRANFAQVRWLDPSSPEAVAMFVASEIVPHDNGWSTAYEARCRTIQALTNILENDGATLGGSHSTRWDSDASRVELVAEDREALAEYLAALQRADKLGPGEMVIRGRVEDSDGTPVAGAIVDLMGPYVYINHFRTREDGTFVMPMTPMTPNETWGYYLRIRPRDGERRNTGRFSLSFDEPERVVIVRMP
jgi:hypothetical protein